MNYIEVNFSCHPASEIINDILSATLGEIGFESFIENKNSIVGYIRKDIFNVKNIEDVLSEFPIESEISFDYKEIEDRNWNEEWEKHYFEPLVIDNKCIIKSTFHNVTETYDYNILIDPKMAFGTGHHQTTELMIREILKENLTEKTVLDMGCGTAILAILASMRGAKAVTAIDIDRWAYDNAIENIALNNIANVSVSIGDADILPRQEVFDIIFANINRNILLADIHIYAKALNVGGSLYMSGFYTEDIELIKIECEKNGLTFCYNTKKNNWACAKFTK